MSEVMVANDGQNRNGSQNAENIASYKSFLRIYFSLSSHLLSSTCRSLTANHSVIHSIWSPRLLMICSKVQTRVFGDLHPNFATSLPDCVSLLHVYCIIFTRSHIASKHLKLWPGLEVVTASSFCKPKTVKHFSSLHNRPPSS